MSRINMDVLNYIQQAVLNYLVRALILDIFNIDEAQHLIDDRISIYRILFLN